MPNRLSQFWQELKRRNVARVVTVYAATAFVILELTDIVAPSLGLPAWTLNLVIILLSIGLIIAVVVSWIYDFHPLGGIVKTKPVEKAEKGDASAFSNSWKIAAYISFVIIIGLVILHVLPRSGKQQVLDKSIAVLPFINDSPEEEGMYFINGSMESILDNLSRIQDLRVVSRTSVEQYRNNLKPVPVIAQEMNVAYVLEGSGLKHGNQIRLTLQLIDASHDTHVWSHSYTRKDEEVFELYSDVAQLVASEIEAIITPEEEERIEQIPTSSTTAYDLYQKAGEAREDEAIELLHYALDYDSTFAGPYIQLGWIFLERYNFNSELNSSYLDSTKQMIEKALHFDPQSADAHSLKGYQLRAVGKSKEALRSFDRALQLNPNLASAYNGRGWFYFGERDYVNALENFYQNISRDRTPVNLRRNYEFIGFAFSMMGLKEEAFQCYEIALQYDADSVWILYRQALTDLYVGEFSEAIRTVLPVNEKLSAKDRDESPRYTSFLPLLGECYMYEGRYEESYKYYHRYVEIADSVGWSLPYQKMNIAYIFNKNGKGDRARELIGTQIRQSEQWIADHQSERNENYQFLAQAYMLKKDRESALSYLRLLSKQERTNVIADRLRINPIFRDLKNDPEFMEIMDQIRASYLGEQERVRQWLADKDLF